MCVAVRTPWQRAVAEPSSLPLPHPCLCPSPPLPASPPAPPLPCRTVPPTTPLTSP